MATATSGTDGVPFRVEMDCPGHLVRCVVPTAKAYGLEPTALRARRSEAGPTRHAVLDGLARDVADLGGFAECLVANGVAHERPSVWINGAWERAGRGKGWA